MGVRPMCGMQSVLYLKCLRIPEALWPGLGLEQGDADVQEDAGAR
jgi:hypothetical protein